MTKTGVRKTFVVQHPIVDFVKTYLSLRPEDLEENFFFTNYQKEVCSKQRIGINKVGRVPRVIANYLKLPNANGYTGHSLRKTSATLLVDAGADILELKRHGYWMSTAVAEHYCAKSMFNKKHTFSKIITGFIVTSETSVLADEQTKTITNSGITSDGLPILQNTSKNKNNSDRVQSCSYNSANAKNITDQFQRSNRTKSLNTSSVQLQKSVKSINVTSNPMEKSKSLMPPLLHRPLFKKKTSKPVIKSIEVVKSATKQHNLNVKSCTESVSNFQLKITEVIKSANIQSHESDIFQNDVI